MSQLIGLSLSKCVRDIADGKVAIGDVAWIWTSTKAITPADWVYVIRTYIINGVWDGDICLMIFETLLREGKIFQPRTFGQRGPNIDLGHWQVVPTA